MFYRIRVILPEIRQAISDGKLRDFIQSRVFFNRVATPVEMDLTTLPTKISLNQDASFEFLELKLDDLQSNKRSISDPSRRLKAFHNLSKGFRWLVIITNTTVIGDIWFICCTHNQGGYIHPDLEMLGIQCGDREAYGFDMYIDPKYRGKNLAVPLQRYLQTVLRNEGYLKVYGYYWDDNLPALWMHRMMKFHELPKRRVTHFIFFRQSRF
jgi:GNAT superfamily N-acetyltransferase